MRPGGSGRERPPVENGGSLPSQLVRTRFRARYATRAADGKPAGTVVFFGGAHFHPAPRHRTAVFRIQPDGRERTASGGEPGAARHRRSRFPAVNAPPRAVTLRSPGFQRACARSRAGTASFGKIVAPARP